eukprot:12888057-Prorocentrum_lima.AAC.1
MLRTWRAAQKRGQEIHPVGENDLKAGKEASPVQSQSECCQISQGGMNSLPGNCKTVGGSDHGRAEDAGNRRESGSK